LLNAVVLLVVLVSDVVVVVVVVATVGDECPFVSILFWWSHLLVSWRDAGVAVPLLRRRSPFDSFAEGKLVAEVLYYKG